MPVSPALARSRGRRDAPERRRADAPRPRRRRSGRRPRLAAARRRRRDPRRGGRAGVPRRVARAGGRADALHPRRRRRPAPVLRRVQARPLHRPRDPHAPLAPTPAPAARLGGARVGDHGAADRGVARGGDPEADGAPLGAGVRLAGPGDGAAPPARRPIAGGRCRVGARRARRLRSLTGAGDRDGEGRPRGRRRPRRPRRPRRSTAASARSRRSAPGRSSASASSAAASPTRSRPATWRTSS